MGAILSIQASGLAENGAHGDQTCRDRTLGGLDSTLAFLVTHRAFGMLGLPSEGIHAITSPVSERRSDQITRFAG